MYPVESDDVFPVNQVLDAHWGVLNDEDVRKNFPCINFINFFLFINLCFLSFTSPLASIKFFMVVTNVQETHIRPFEQGPMLIRLGCINPDCLSPELGINFATNVHGHVLIHEDIISHLPLPAK